MLNKEADYFLISVSNKENLELCIRYGMAGFTNSINGLWTFWDIKEGDYVSFLYGARVRNLYKVIKKVAYKNAENLPPWSPVTFRMSGRTYYFPFRLFLKQERELNEPMVRPEFTYVAENLLLRGGYRKTHFQADTITFYNVSTMGAVSNSKREILNIEADSFEPKIVFRREHQKIPEKFYFQELILQTLIRRKIQSSVFDNILKILSINHSPHEFEVLGEKALPEGFVDIFIKLKHPVGANIYLLVEVKTGKACKKDIEQLKGYISEFSNEVVGGVLIAKEFPKSIQREKYIIPVRYYFKDISSLSEYTYRQLFHSLRLEIV